MNPQKIFKKCYDERISFYKQYIHTQQSLIKFQICFKPILDYLLQI